MAPRDANTIARLWALKASGYIDAVPAVACIRRERP